jgi:hypothetical protein
MLITSVAAVTLYIAAIFQGGQFLDGKLFTDQAECNDVVTEVVKYMGDDHKNYEWVICEAVTVGTVGGAAASRPTAASIETP